VETKQKTECTEGIKDTNVKAADVATHEAMVKDIIQAYDQINLYKHIIKKAYNLYG